MRSFTEICLLTTGRAPFRPKTKTISVKLPILQQTRVEFFVVEPLGLETMHHSRKCNRLSQMRNPTNPGNRALETKSES